jgi:hypothetical protein
MLTVLQEAVNPIYLLAWIPETLLDERGASEWDKFVHIEEKTFFDQQEEEEGESSAVCIVWELKPSQMLFSSTCPHLVPKLMRSLSP